MGRTANGDWPSPFGLDLRRWLRTIESASQYGGVVTNAARASLVASATVLPVTNVNRSIEHYRALGFEVAKVTDEYAIAQRDGLALHLSLMPDLDPLTGAGCVYLYVDDADQLAREWVATSVGRTVPPTDTDYGLREGAHVDPDNNLLRFGADITG